MHFFPGAISMKVHLAANCWKVSAICRSQNLKSLIPGSSPWWGSAASTAHGSMPGAGQVSLGSGSVLRLPWKPWRLKLVISMFLWVGSLKKNHLQGVASPAPAVLFILFADSGVTGLQLLPCACGTSLLVIHANIYPCWSSNGSVSESLNRWPFTKRQESQSSQFSLEAKDSQQIHGILQSQSKIIHFSSLCHICHVSASRKCSCSRIILKGALNKSPVTCQAWLTRAALLCNHQWFTLLPPLCLKALWGHWNMLLCQSKILKQRACSVCVVSLAATSDLLLTAMSCLPCDAPRRDERLLQDLQKRAEYEFNNSFKIVLNLLLTSSGCLNL